VVTGNPLEKETTATFLADRKLKQFGKKFILVDGGVVIKTQVLLNHFHKIQSLTHKFINQPI
jgi:hypothetical protein